jgi:hypothetical protein
MSDSSYANDGHKFAIGHKIQSKKNLLSQVFSSVNSFQPMCKPPLSEKSAPVA